MKESFGEMGIDFEEKAFYDKTKYVNWNNRDDIKAELKMHLIKLLAKFG
ncbi:MAG: DUF3387 domain-containing protein [Bacteroidales bacterium]|nr:DUF3387 domain-containing protein [Bacteroidales bacterium]